MANEFKVKNGLIVIGDLTTSGTITINGALAATQSWVTSQAYLTSASLSGYATQSYVTSAISSLIDAAPAALDTLNELAAALGDDANFSTTITNSIASKLSLSGGTMTGQILFQTSALNNGFRWDVNSDAAGITFKNTGDGDANSYFNFFTEDNGNEYFKFSHNTWNIGSFDFMDVKNGVVRTNGNIYVNASQSGSRSSGTNELINGNRVWHDGDFSSSNISNWNTAYSWGNHATVGYLTSYTETDTLSSVTGRGATTNTSITVGPDLTVQADGSVNYTASRLWLKSHNNYRGAGVHMSGTGSTWFAGTPYTDFEGGYVIAKTAISNDVSSAQYSNALLTVKSGGNVGIGTSNPGSKLSVLGNNDVFSVISQTGDTSFATRLVAQYVGLFNNGANGHHLYINSSQELGPAEFNLTKTWGGLLTLGVSSDGTARTRALYVNSNGYVGVNVNPISGDRFEVAGTLRVHTGNNWDGIQIYAGGADGYIRGIGDETGLHIRSEFGNVLLADDRGNVGIGTTSPTNKLDVLGKIKIDIDGTYGSGYSTIGFGGTTNGYNRVFGNNGTSDGLFLASATGVGIYFRTNGGSTDHMVITSAGNVGIGTTTPYGKLDVYTGGSGSWTRFVVTTTDLWGDSGTQYVTIGAGGATGIMIHNPHIVWDGTKAAIRLGRSGGVSGGAWYQVGTMTGDEFMIAKNGEWSNGGIKINSSGVLYYGNTGYRYIWENGTWGINITGNANYATTAGSANTATTAGALTSMNISQFTNNSGYVAYGNYSWTSPVFGQYGIKSNLIDNVLYSAADRFEVFKDGIAWNTNCIFNLNYDQSCDVIPISTSRTYSIILNTKNNPSYGIVYTEGNIYLSFYYVQIPDSVSGRVRFQNGTWVAMSGWTNVANSGSYAVWRGNVPGGNYMVEIEITINANSSNNTWFAQWEYVMGRPGQYELGIINKAQDNSLWRTLYFKDSNNTTKVDIGSGGITSYSNINISGTNSLYFTNYGGGFYMQDSSWIRTHNYKSIWTQTGLLGSDGGLTVGYGGSTPPSGGAIIAGTVGIGTSSPSYKLDVNGTGRYAGVLTVDTDILTRTKLQISNGRLFELIGSSTALNIYDSSAGASRLYITDGGNIGVGTTNPGTKLHVVGNAWINRPSNKVDNAGATELGPRVEFNNSFASGQSGYVIFRYPTYNNFLISGDYDGNVGGAIPNIQFGKQSTVYLHMNSSNGNIGIGTTSPSYKLHVVGDLYVNGTNGAFTTDNSQSNLYFLNLTRSTTSLVTAGNVGIKVANPTATLSLGTSSYDNNPLAGLEYSQVTGGGRLDLKVQTWGTGSNYGLTTGLSVLTPGFDTADVRVGIGTTSPATPLHVTGGATGTGGWNRTATLAATYPGLIFNSNGTKWGGMAYDYSAAMRFWVNANNDDIFAGTLAMSILNNGNVGIATSNPIYKLQVAGSAYVNGGTLFLDSSEYLRWGNSNQGIVGVNDSHVAILSGGAIRQTIYAEGRTYFPGLDLSISNVNGSHGSGTYFRGDGGHFVFGLTSGNTLYLNYGNSAGILRTFGTWYHESTQILSTSRVLTNVSGNISMFTNDAGYLTSVSDVWVNTSGDTMTGSLLFADVADNVRLQKGSSFLNLRDPWNNTHLSNGAGGGHYFDASHFYLRSTGGGTTWLYLDGSNLNVSVEQNNYSRVYFRYNVDRYSQTWYNSTTGAYWWVTTDADKLGFHRNGDGDKFYFGNTGDFYSATNGWLSTALAAKQNASTAITTSNIASQSVSYANSAGEAGQVTNQSGQLLRYDNRTISPSETTAGYLQFGFTSWGNDNSSPYADYLHMRSYTDGSGGNDNLVMFLKSGIGMRIYQQTFGSATAYSSYADVWTTANFTSTNVSNWNTAYGWGNHASYGYATTSYVTTQINNLIAGAPGALDTLDELAAALGDDSNFATTVTNSIAGKVSKSGDTMTGALNIDYSNAYLYIRSEASGSGVQWHKQMWFGRYDNIQTPGQYPNYLPAGAYGYHVTQSSDALFVGLISRGAENNDYNAVIAWGDDGGDVLQFRFNNNVVATLSEGGSLTVAGSLTESSSLKLKENVETSEGNLEKVVNLRPVTYNKIGSQTTELGLIAEEVAEVYPEFVQYDENGEPIGVNYSRLTAALIGAVKELTNQVQELNKKING